MGCPLGITGKTCGGGGEGRKRVENVIFVEKFLVDFGPFFGHSRANLQVQSLSLCLPDFLNIFSRPILGHFWPFLDHFVVKFCHFLTKIDNFLF